MKIRRAESFSRGQAQQLKTKTKGRRLHTRTAGSTSYVRVCSRHNMSILARATVRYSTVGVMFNSVTIFLY